MNQDSQKQAAYTKWKKSQAHIATINKTISELKVGANNAKSSVILQRYEKLIDDKTELLKQTELQTTDFYNQLEALNGKGQEEGAPATNNPYAKVKRSSLSDATKVKIIKEHGREAYMAQPL